MTEDRMRRIVGTLIQEQVAEFHGLRTCLVGMVERMTQMSSHFGACITTAEAQITARQEPATSDIQARDAQLRQFLDASVVSRSDHFDLLTKQLVDKIETSEADIVRNLDAAVVRLSAYAAASVQRTNSKSVALYEDMRRHM